MKTVAAPVLVLLIALSGCVGADSEKSDPLLVTEPPVDTSLESPSGDTAVAQAALSLSLDPLASITASELVLQGTVTRAARVSVEAIDDEIAYFQHTMQADGPWSLQLVNIPYGQSVVRVSADDGLTHVTDELLLVRLAPFTFEVQYGGYPGPSDATVDVLMDIDAFLSGPAYAGKSAPHPDFANVHDLTLQWAQQTGDAVEVAWDEGLQGFSMSKINGVGSPLSSTYPPYWALYVNDDLADFGMTLMPVVPGDHVAWCLNACRPA